MASEILRDLGRQMEIANVVLEKWEKRSEAKEVKSRWSLKDERDHGKRVENHTRRCKSEIENFRRQRGRFAEQQRFVEHRHNTMISQMQLREARTSTQSAEDIRLFTYVTIIFLPLSFSTSLFGMQSKPSGDIVLTMLQTTAIALAITFFFLANMKPIDRNGRFWSKRLDRATRKRMKESEDSWNLSWKDIAEDLEQAAKRKLVKPDDDERVPSESKWFYLVFWLMYTIRRPGTHVTKTISKWRTASTRNGIELKLETHHTTTELLLCSVLVPVTLISMLLHVVFNIISDFFAIIRRSGYHAGGHGKVSPEDDKTKVTMNRQPGPDDVSEHESNREQGTKIHLWTRLQRLAATGPGQWSAFLAKLYRWLDNPPRPLGKYVQQAESSSQDEKDSNAEHPKTDIPQDSNHGLLRTEDIESNCEEGERYPWDFGSLAEKDTKHQPSNEVHENSSHSFSRTLSGERFLSWRNSKPDKKNEPEPTV